MLQWSSARTHARSHACSPARMCARSHVRAHRAAVRTLQLPVPRSRMCGAHVDANVPNNMHKSVCCLPRALLPC
eukprot:3726882-Pleurochrysis_carterae.AAC.2